MIYTLAGLVSMMALGTFAWQFFTRLRSLESAASGCQSSGSPVNLSGRYRPMLRLLSEDDFGLVATNPKLAKALRAERQKLFRGYLRCLTKEYGKLLAGIRLVMVQSRVDRPDLAKALAKNRMNFAWAICRIEMHLYMQSFGIGKVDISAVVDAFDRLRDSAVALSALPAAA